MRETKVALRYAKSLLLLAKEQEKLDQVNADMQSLAKTCLENKELVVMLNSPIIKADKKNQVLEAVFSSFTELSQKFMALMTNKTREYLLPTVAEKFSDLYREEQGIIQAVVTSAVALDDNIRSQIKAKIGTDKKIEFVEKIDSSLIGGFIVRVGDKQFDGSISRSIVELKKTFSKNEFIAAF